MHRLQCHTRTPCAEPRPSVLVAEKLGDAGIQMLQKFANVDTSYSLTPDQLCEKISQYDALIVRSGTKASCQG